MSIHLFYITRIAGIADPINKYSLSDSIEQNSYFFPKNNSKKVKNLLKTLELKISVLS